MDQVFDGDDEKGTESPDGHTPQRKLEDFPVRGQSVDQGDLLNSEMH